MPAGTALFGNSSRNQSKNLLEFKAGKMTMKGKTVYPDKRKGVVYIYQSDDSLMHFCWRDRTSGTVEDDLIIFPDDVEFKHVPQCTTGRVYLLKFKSSSRKFFFWVQEPKTDKDEENCRKVNEILNNPPALGSQRSGGATPDSDLQNLLSNMSQQQLMQLFGGVGQISGLSNLLSHINRPQSSGSGGGSSSPSTTSTTAAVTSGSPATGFGTPSEGATSAVTPAAPKKERDAKKTANMIRSMIEDIQESPRSSRGRKRSDREVPGTAANPIDLSSGMTSEFLSSILGDPALVSELEQLLPTVPDGGQNDRLTATLSSPHFQQAVSMFSSALQSGQLGPIVSQFEVGDEAVNAATQGNMEEFVRALQAANLNNGEQSTAKKSEEEEKKKNNPAPDKKDDDDSMSLD